MGIDAESTDLTARIQRRRRALLAAGEIEPARPGEYPVFRGGPAAAPPPEPRSRDTRVVQLDETPTRGGAAALDELPETSGTDEAGASATAPELGDVPVAKDTEQTSGLIEINEFGEKVDPDYDPRREFNLSDFPAFENHEELPEADTVNLPNVPRKRRTSHVEERHAALLFRLTALEEQLLIIEARLNLIAESHDKRFDAVDQALVLIAEFLSEQTKPLGYHDFGDERDPGPIRAVINTQILEVPEGETIYQAEFIPVEKPSRLSRLRRFFWGA